MLLFFTSNDYFSIVTLDLLVDSSMSGVVLEQVNHVIRGDEWVVDVSHLNYIYYYYFITFKLKKNSFLMFYRETIVQTRPEAHSANPAKPIDSNSCHNFQNKK